MANYEEEMRKQMEAAAKEQQVAPSECPVEGEMDAAFGFREVKKKLKKSGRVPETAAIKRKGKGDMNLYAGRNKVVATVSRKKN